MESFNVQQHDLSTSIFTSDGKVLQIEYAEKCVDKSETIVGVICKDGVVLGAEKVLKSNLLVPTTDKRIYNIDSHVGMVIAIGGKVPDSKNVMLRARMEAETYYKQYGVDVNGKVLSNRVSQFVHQYTLYWSYRPLGVAAILAAHDHSGYNLHMIRPSGECFQYYHCTQGKGKQIVKTELERRDFRTVPCKEALFHVSKMLLKTHDESSDKKYKLELSWISDDTNHKHQRVPENLIEQAEREAIASIEQDQMGSESEESEDDQ